MPGSTLLLLIGLTACAACRPAATPDKGSQPQSQQSRVTFTKDIAPILFASCSPCHQPGQGAPFALLTYQDVASRAQSIVEMIERRLMPPWQPEPGYGTFSNERRLRDDQIEVIRRWVAEGAIEGESTNLGASPRPRLDGWQLGQPDLVVELPRAYTLRANGADTFRNFVIPLTRPSASYVRGVEFQPRSNRSVIHHAVIGIDRTRNSRMLDGQGGEPGYDDLLSREGLQGPEGRFLSWTPGKAPLMEPADMAWRLDRGTDLVIQLHMIPSGREETIRPRLALFFGDAAPTREPVLIKLGSKAIDIPAGDAAYTISDGYVLPTDVDLLSVYPHAHYLAKDIRGLATLPDGTTKWLIWIKEWNFNWQDEYRYATPVFLPKGTRVSMHYLYDNSPANPRNPHQPPKRVSYGPRSSDEMGDLWLQVVPRKRADALVLASDYAERELRANVIGAEMMVRSKPHDLEALNWVATSYLRVGKVLEAVPYLEEALRINAESAEVRYNLGSALQMQGRTEEALLQFRAASRLSPKDDRVQLGLANALNSSGSTVEAVRYYRETLALNPDSAEAHNNLGMVLGSHGQIDEAMRHFQQALGIQADYADAHNNLGIALGARGQVKEAVAHFQRALELRPDNSSARQNLEALLELQGIRR